MPDKYDILRMKELKNNEKKNKFVRVKIFFYLCTS